MPDRPPGDSVQIRLRFFHTLRANATAAYRCAILADKGPRFDSGPHAPSAKNQCDFFLSHPLAVYNFFAPTYFFSNLTIVFIQPVSNPAAVMC